MSPAIARTLSNVYVRIWLMLHASKWIWLEMQRFWESALLSLHSAQFCDAIQPNLVMLSSPIL